MKGTSTIKVASMKLTDNFCCKMVPHTLKDEASTVLCFQLYSTCYTAVKNASKFQSKLLEMFRVNFKSHFAVREN